MELGKTRENFVHPLATDTHSHTRSLTHTPFTCLARLIDVVSHWIPCLLQNQFSFMCVVMCARGFLFQKKKKTFSTFIIGRLISGQHIQWCCSAINSNKTDYTLFFIPLETIYFKRNMWDRNHRRPSKLWRKKTNKQQETTIFYV